MFDIGQHNHALSDEAIRWQIVVNEIKDNIRDDQSAPLRRVYDQSVVAVLRCVNAPSPEEITLFHQVSSQLKRTKYKNIPPIPNDTEDDEINDVWRLTWEGDDYIIHQYNDWEVSFLRQNRISVFSDTVVVSRPRCASSHMPYAPQRHRLILASDSGYQKQNISTNQQEMETLDRYF